MLYHITNPKTRISDFELETFEQCWGNTSGGFEGMGGSATTNQRTYVLIPNGITEDKAFVFFGGRFAYKADFCKAFKEDLQRHQLVGVTNGNKYIETSD